MKTGIELIAEERHRQISKEGWAPEHDDQHANCELVWAANGYAYLAAGSPGASAILAAGAPPAGWPWEREWWKPSKDHVRNLTKAGALIAAEIDRLQRLPQQPTPSA